MILERNQFELPLDSDPQKRCTNGFAFIALFLILLCVYANSFDAAWQYDDHLNIVKNTNIRLKSFSWASIFKTFNGVNQHRTTISRPVSFLSFGLNYYFSEYRVWAYHAANFLIHLTSAIFLYLFIKSVLRLPACQGRYENSADAIALLAVFFWAPHPIHVTAVTYIVQRMASMAGMFYIMSMYFFLKARRSSQSMQKPILFGFCILTGILAIGSKENAIMLPISLLVLDVVVLQYPDKQKRARNWVIAMLIVAFVLSLSVYYVDLSKIPDSFTSRPFSLTQRLLTEPRVIVRYLALLFYPISSQLTLLHDVPISSGWLNPFTTLPAWLLLLTLGGGALWWQRKTPFLSYCIIFFLLNHIVEGSVIALELVYEHRNYIPSMFIFVPVAVMVVKALNYFAYRAALQGLVAVCTIFVLAAHAHTTYCYNQVFHNELTLWADNVKKSPHLSITHNNFGQALRRRGETILAKESFERAHKLNRYHNKWQKGVVLYNLGLHTAYEENDYGKALKQFNQASQYLSSHSDLIQHKALAALMLDRKNYSEQILMQGLQRFPQKYELIQTLGVLRLIQEQPTDAFYLASRAYPMGADPMLSLFIMAQACHQKGELELAIAYWEKVMRMDPVNALGAMSLCVLFNDMQNLPAKDRYMGLLRYLKTDQTWKAYWQSIVKKDINRFFLPTFSRFYSLIEQGGVGAK